MEILLVVLLMLAFPTGQSYRTGQASSSCYALCPAGYYRVGHCSDAVKKYSCKRCDYDTFTDRENFAVRCERCGSCSNNQKIIRPCLANQSVLCDCEEGFYNSSTDPDNINCLKCPCRSCQGPDDNEDYIRKCRPCQSKECLKHPECKRDCTNPSTSTTPLATVFTTTRAPTTATTTTATRTSASTLKPDVTSTVPLGPVNLRVLLVLPSLVVIFLVLFWLRLLFCRNPTTKSCLCWNVNKDVELSVKAPKLTESTDQGGIMTTLALNRPDGTPMMTLSPSTAPDHPSHSSPLLPGAEHKAARQDQQSEHWPAIVLYAIIKEVPLRRWKEFLRLLSVADQQLERVELEAGLGQGSMERQYQMLRLWSQRPSASMNDVFSALHHMDLSGCAQLLQESLEKLQGRPEVMQGFTA